MNTLTFKSSGLSASAPSAGLWQRAANLYWTGWTQYAASLNTDVSLRPDFPIWKRAAKGVGANGVRADALTPSGGLTPPEGLTPLGAQRIVDRAA